LQTPLFILLGYSSNKEVEYLSILHDKLNERLKKIIPTLLIYRKYDLLTIRYENASIYISIIYAKEEMSSWIKLAQDFQISIDLTELNDSLLEQRLNLKRNDFPNDYMEIHYILVRNIFELMRPDLSVYGFF